MSTPYLAEIRLTSFAFAPRGWAMCNGQLLAINQEDLTKELHQQNLPGSTWQYPNWGRKMRFSIEDLRHGAARGYTAMFADWIARTGRRNSVP